MSSYRSSYTPWKSNYTSSYKSGASSNYSSRDDVSSARYGSLAAPSTYRPSFSGGTYRIKRDPPSSYQPVASAYSNRYSTSASTARNDKETATDASQLRRYNTTASKYGSSREPSPAAIELTNRMKSREPSPISRTLRGKSRDPSPVVDSSCKIGYSGINSYRMSVPRSTPTSASTGYNSRYGSTTSTRSTAAATPDKSISYLSASDFRARSISRGQESANDGGRKSSDNELEDKPEKAEEENEKTEEIVESEESESDAEETFVPVSVVTRATSPTPPGNTIVQRTRRIDIAKTIEKTIQRSTKRKKMHEKGIQSDRLDDSTRYSRFGLSARVPSYSPHSESRYSSSNLRYSSSPLSSTSKSSHYGSSSTNEVKKENTITSTSSKGAGASSNKSKLSPPKVVRINSRQSSVENLSANKPPAAPKAESPTKSISSSSQTVLKLPNKDFRKSALNVGPTDRPRKSRTPSSGTDSDVVPQSAVENTNGGGALNSKKRQERSPSAGSEVSTASTSSARRTGNDQKVRPRCHAKPSSSLCRHNSSNNLKNGAHKSCTPSTSTTSSSTAASSSSGTESSSENRKTNRKNGKKKTPNSHKKDTAVANGNSNKVSLKKCAASTGDAYKLLSRQKSSASDENSNTTQPPAAAVVATTNEPQKTTAAAEVGAESSRACSKSPFSPQEKNAHRLQKLSSVSNFFAARQNDANSEPIFFESSENSGESESNPLISSLTGDCETNTSTANNAAETITTLDPASTAESTFTTSKQDLYTTLESTEDISATSSSLMRTQHTDACSLAATSLETTESQSKAITKSSSSIFPRDTAGASDSALPLRAHIQGPTELYTTTNTAPTSTTTSTDEPDESSWWQDTNRQINTASALDFNQKEDMRFKLRHIDSGETAWWLRNDEEDTLADDTLNTLNQEEEDASEATDQLPSLSNDTNHQSGNKTDKIRYNWWTNDQTDEEAANENDQNKTNCNTDRSAEGKLNPSENESSDGREVRRIARSNCSMEKQWWSESNGNSKDSTKDDKSSNSGKQNATIQLKICRVESGERPWWLDNEDDKNNTTAEVTVKLPARRSEPVEHFTSDSKNANDEKKPWWMSGPAKIKFNVPRVESGEKAWWQQDDEEEQNPETNQRKSMPQSNLKRWDSGEKAWWLQGDEQPISNGNAKSTVQRSDDDGEVDVDNNNSDDEANQNNDAEVISIVRHIDPQQNFGTNHVDANTELSNSFDFASSERPPPLGQCASPVGLEEPYNGGIESPFDNIPMSKVQNNNNHHLQQLAQYQQSNQQQSAHYDKNRRAQEKLFISRHQNIDELLGGSCRPLSPMFLYGNSFSSVPSTKNSLLEEITPDQVRIHDSTAQMPVIQRMERDEWDNYNQMPPGNNAAGYEPERIHDAAIQVYKDGDYGAYLDLELSLAEQAEEIEGLNANRNNSLVVRTQLSVRVHAIIEKLLSSEGSELRRALFSLKQVFQEDKDLVHAFVALGGLNCLVRVGNGADQNYQNYILRALGQVMLYVDGMNGVMKHEPTMQWLYSLIASNYRSVVKTALKLLLVFVEYAETNCYVLVNAIHAVDQTQGTLPWSNIMRLLKDYDNADAELVIYATSLINKTLAGLNDQDSFYDESDLLEQQGMESVIQRYMSKPGTDLDLLDQLQLYEAVLKFEDGESEGIRLPDNSLRKTQRHRPGTDTAERRKSRRHSTGTSPTVPNKVIPSPKRMTPTYGVLDEDSSSSTNSAEYNGGVFTERKAREGVGVTPGLRRRRERAERHKSFLKEQQEAAANGILAALEKREEIGQIVMAIPATVKNADSPPDSLTLTNENLTSISNSNSNINCSSNHNSSINYSNIIANATNNITSNSQHQNINTTGIKNSNNNNNVISPTKHLLSNNTISVINTGLDKTLLNNNNSNNKLSGTPEFLTKKNLLMERNATVINGIMKNIQRGTEADNHNTNSSYKKFENDANRLNNFYSHVSTPKHQNQSQQQSAVQQSQHQNYNSTPTPTIQSAHSVLAAVLSPKKSLNGFDFTQSPSITTTSICNKSDATPSEPNMPPDISLEPTCDLPPSNLSPLTPITPSTTQLQPIANMPMSPKHSTPSSTAAPPPPPPPPPPPDLMGFNFALHHARPFMPPVANVTPDHIQCSSASSDVLPVAESENEDKKLLQQLKRDHTVKDLTQKLTNMPTSPSHEDKLQNRIVGDMSGLISKAKEGLAKSKSKGEMSRSSSVDQDIKKPEPKKSENELHWEELVRSMARPLNLCDLDFTDLNSDDEKDVLAPRGLCGGVPPPPPPLGVAPPPLMPTHMMCPPPMNMSHAVPPPIFGYSNYGNQSLTNSAHSSMNGSTNGDISNTNTIKKNKKTVKLFWKEVREDMIPIVVGKTIWDELPQAQVDTQKLEHLFESRAKDLMTKKQQELNKSKEIIVLDHKRSNAINIAMTKLPPPRAIKAAILKMDATVVTREGIDKLLNMLPTDEERGKIQEAQLANPELPLGSAEQFLLTLASISELGARLKLWAFRLDFDNSEKEIAEPLMDLKQGIEILRNNRTFKCILSTLLSVGIFLNGAPVKGFQIEYLAKVPEVKDTVHKHSLLHHLCHMVMEANADTTDLYSEIGPITRASKADYSDLAHNLNQLESECKSSWDRLKLIAKHDCPPQLKQKLVDFLADCAERIIILQIVHRRVINRYRKFLLWLGVPQHSVAESKPNEFCRILSEFALEYRTTRERVQQQLEKKANHRERNKTRGKLIIDMAKFKTKEDRADAELKVLLGTPSADTADGTLTWRRRRAENLRSPITRQSEENFTDGDDEILESLVKTATKAPGTRTTPRERKRTRHADRKSLRRTLKNGLTEEEKQHVAALIKTY